MHPAMRPALTLIIACMAVATAVGPIWAGPPEQDSLIAEHMWIELHPIDSMHWRATVHLRNPDPLAALTLPFTWRGGQSFYFADSANYAATRVEYFALKTYLADTANQTVLIGLISDLGMDLPPLEPGSGPIAHLYFTARDSGTSPPLLDTTFILPHNTLQLVTPDVRAITPEFEVRQFRSTAPAKSEKP
jgi:hypothetical protein